MADKDVAIRGGIWTGISTAVVMISQLLRVMILARFLEKADFGIVSITNLVVGLCLTFTDLGFSSVIMYSQKLDRKEFNSLYWMQFILFIVIYLLLFFLSPVLASFYKEPILRIVIPIASLSVIFQAIGKIYDSVLQKQYQFKQLAIRNIIACVISLVLAVFLAWRGLGVYSLVYSTLLQIIIVNVWNFLSGSKYQKVGFSVEFRKTFKLAKIGFYQTGSHILDFLSYKLDVIIIGKFLGTEALGLYDLSKEMVVKFVSFINTVVSKVALPIISNSNTDDNIVRVRFLQTTKVVAYVCVPICVFVAIFSKWVVTLMYGASYLEITPIVSIFAVMTIISCITSYFSMLSIAKGRTDLNFKYTWIRIISTIPVIVLTSLVSLQAVAFGQLGLTMIMAIVIWKMLVSNTYAIPFKDFFRQFEKLLVFLSMMSVLFIIITKLNVVSFIHNDIAQLLIYAIMYFGVLFIGFTTFLKNETSTYFELLRKGRK